MTHAIPLWCALAALAWASPARAQVSVEVSPLRIELQASAGSTTTQAITISNAGKEPVRVRAALTDWDLSRDGAPQFEGAAQGGPYSATGWVRIAPPEQVIDAGKEGIVRFSLAVPAGTQPAGYRTGVLFEFGPASGDPVARAREIQFKSRIASLIYVNIGQPPAALELIDLRIRPSAAETQVVATLKNTSRRSVRTKGTLVLYDRSGAAVREVPVPDVPVLPESEREVAIVVADETRPALPAGEYRVEVKIDAGTAELIVGETTLKLPK
jgi:P pilus assembly chaperone PapD